MNWKVNVQALLYKGRNAVFTIEDWEYMLFVPLCFSCSLAEKALNVGIFQVHQDLDSKGGLNQHGHCTEREYLREEIRCTYNAFISPNIGS